MTDKPDANEAAKRVRNSDAAGINHADIYGYDVTFDLATLGRAYLSQQPTYTELQSKLAKYDDAIDAYEQGGAK
jgi:hypothetical protein